MTDQAEPKALSRFRRLIRVMLTIASVAAFAVTAGFLVVTLAFRDPTLAPALLDALFVVALGAWAAAIVLAVVLWRHWTRWLLLLLLPALLVPSVVGLFMMPIAADIAALKLPDGRKVHLAIEPVPTDVIYDLWLSSGPIWTRVDTQLEYSEDGRFVGGEKLALSRDGRRLLLGRGGIWTDCLAIASNFAPCNLGLEPAFWFESDFEAKMRANSAEIAKLR